MKKGLCVAVVVLALATGWAQAQTMCNINEQGSLLVYPLIDNINADTIIEIVNQGDLPVWVQGYMIGHLPGTPDAFIKKDFIIWITPKEPIWWNTSQPYNRRNILGWINQIEAMDGMKGFMFMWAVSSVTDPLEINWDFLRGDAVVYTSTQAFQYNAYPHQTVATVVGDRVLVLDGVNEYCAAPGQIMTQGFARQLIGTNTYVGGTLAVASLGIDFINTMQPEFDINVSVWNQNEAWQSRHLSFYQFQQYDLVNDLQLDISQIFTRKWQLIATATQPMWAVFFQNAGLRAWGSLVWQHPLVPLPAVVVLPPIPVDGP
jgi:hypothetical protein